MAHLDQGGFAGGHTVTRPAPPDLRDLVESSFVRRDDALDRPVGATAWRIVPEANANLVAVARDTGRGVAIDANVVGARSRHRDTEVASRRFTVGVRLRPAVLSRIARERATSFTDRAFSLHDVFGSAGRRATERLDPSDPEAALAALFDLLREASRTDRDTRTPHRLFEAAVAARSVAEWASSLAMPVRTLHVRTRDAIGLSPKLLLRIVRVHRALEEQRSSPQSRGWAAIAVDSGFADQAHLVREVRALLGESPGRWLARRALRLADSFKTAPRRAG